MLNKTAKQLNLELSKDLSEQCVAALDALRNVGEDLDEGDTPPSAALLESVGQLVLRLNGLIDLPIDIYAMPEGDLVLNISAESNHDMLFIQCELDGTIYCMTKFANRRTRRIYTSVEVLPDQSVTRAIERLSVGSN